MRLIDKAYPGKMRKMIVRQALPREHRDSGERALKKRRPLAAGTENPPLIGGMPKAGGKTDA